MFQILLDSPNIAVFFSAVILAQTASLVFFGYYCLKVKLVFARNFSLNGFYGLVFGFVELLNILVWMAIVYFPYHTFVKTAIPHVCLAPRDNCQIDDYAEFSFWIIPLVLNAVCLFGLPSFRKIMKETEPYIYEGRRNSWFKL